MLETSVRSLNVLQEKVLRSYQRMMATRGIVLTIRDMEAPGPNVVGHTERSSPEKARDGYWELGDRAWLPPGADGFRWIWHAGPLSHLDDADPRVVLVPRVDLFELRDLDNSAEGWKTYRRLIDVPWSEKSDRIYFTGHFTGAPQSSENARFRACSTIRQHFHDEHVDVGLLPRFMPQRLRPIAWMRRILRRHERPLHDLARHKFVLSLWGNHPFNPRLLRGLEAGCLVCHQATPTVRMLHDGLFVPGEHYVEVKADLSDLVERIDFYVSRPNEARAIAASGQARWRETLLMREPYVLPELIWERWMAQPRWRESYEQLNVTAPPD